MIVSDISFNRMEKLPVNIVILGAERRKKKENLNNDLLIQKIWFAQKVFEQNSCRL